MQRTVVFDGAEPAAFFELNSRSSRTAGKRCHHIPYGKLAVGSTGVLSFEFKSKGLPMGLLSSSALQESGFVTASNGTVSVVRNAPRLNAVKLYLDYLLSSEAQLAWSKASGLSSLRRDVSRDHIPELLVPKENITYQENHTEKYVLMRKEIVDFINSVLPR